jgi:hypothetical protein
VSKNPTSLAQERGESLPLALIALAIGTLLIAPLLARVSASLQVTTKVERTTHTQYASDAGVEYALWALAHDGSLRSALLDTLGTEQALALPQEVNATAAAVRVVAVEASERTHAGAPSKLPYAIFGNNTSRTNTVVMSGSGHRVIGAVHSNNQIRMTGTGHSVHGLATYAGDLSVVGTGHYFVPGRPGNPQPDSVRTFPLAWSIDDMAPGGALAQQAGDLYTVHEGKWSVSGAGVVVPPGLHYCLGDVHISGAGVTGHNVTIVARGSIDISGSGMHFTPFISGLTFFSDKASHTNVISISGSGSTGGTSYAPNGKISLTGSGGTIVGAFMGDVVAIGGSGATIQLADIDVPSPRDTCGMYDIESTADTTRTLVRATDCDAEGLQVISWSVDSAPAGE